MSVLTHGMHMGVLYPLTVFCLNLYEHTIDIYSSPYILATMFFLEIDLITYCLLITSLYRTL